MANRPPPCKGPCQYAVQGFAECPPFDCVEAGHADIRLPSPYPGTPLPAHAMPGPAGVAARAAALVHAMHRRVTDIDGAAGTELGHPLPGHAGAQPARED